MIHFIILFLFHSINNTLFSAHHHTTLKWYAVRISIFHDLPIKKGIKKAFIFKHIKNIEAYTSKAQIKILCPWWKYAYFLPIPSSAFSIISIYKVYSNIYYRNHTYCGILLLNWLTIVSVSYTHLDVYKRQLDSKPFHSITSIIYRFIVNFIISWPAVWENRWIVNLLGETANDSQCSFFVYRSKRNLKSAAISCCFTYSSTSALTCPCTLEK